MTIGLIRPIRGLGKIATLGKKAILKPRKTDSADDLPDNIRQMVGYMGETNARTVWRMQKRGIRGTAPELLVYAWLEKRRLQFEFQSSQFGGRKIRGGLVTDFIVYLGTRPMAWRIQGEHWHGTAVAKERDASTKLRLLMTKYRGQRFIACVDLWENDIYKAVGSVCEEALRGKGRRG